MNEDLNLKQETFCQLFASDKEFFGNGTTAYVEAYDVDTSKPNYYKTAAAAASRLLTNVKVLERINEIFETRGLNDVFVDKQLEMLITQNASYLAKMQAIKEYNALKQRITKKLEVEHSGEVNGIADPKMAIEFAEYLKRQHD